MKRLTILLFSALCLASCRTGTHEYFIGVSQCSDDEWRQKMNGEMTTEALMYDRLRLEIRSADDDNRRQIEDIRYFIDRKVDLLIVAPNEAVPMTAVVEEAFDRGIPVIVVDRKIHSDRYTAFVGADNLLIGKTIGEYIRKRSPAHTRMIELTGLSGSTPAIERHAGLRSVLDDVPGTETLAVEDAAWGRAEAMAITDSLLSLYPQVDLIFAHNDRMAYGAYLAARQRGREKEISFIGIDAVPGKNNGVELVSAGILDATFIYPTDGDKVIRMAMDILEGRAFPRETILRTAIVDHTNARLMELQTSQITEQQQKIRNLNHRIDNHLLRYANLQTYALIGLLCLIAIVILLLAVWRSLRLQSRLNDDLRRSNDEITQQKEKLEAQRDQLIELSRKLEEATQAKLVFFTNISHDFRTPLSLISGPIEQLLGDDTLSEDQRYLLELISRNVDILLKLMNQILDFRKYENGKLELTCTQIDLKESLMRWNDSFMHFLRSKCIRFGFETEEGTGYRIAADAEKLERAYFNILSNAVKFTPPNGRIDVRLDSPERDGEGWLRITVANSGSYIPPDQAERIFDRFYQGARTDTGYGIGLAISQAFVELHGGKILVESDETAGTRFFIELPVRACPEASGQSAEPSGPTIALPMVSEREDDARDAAGDESRQVILIIDDNPDIRDYVYRLFRNEYHVLEAADGHEGICKAMRCVPDVIISDVLMPAPDGIELCSILKKELQTSHIPIILLTACSLDEQRVVGLRSGADAYLSKPFNATVLIATVANLIANRNKLRLNFEEHFTFGGMEKVNRTDKLFVERFKELIEKDMEDPDLNVESLGKRLGVNRVQLYRKVKTLTGFSPNEFLRIMRLRKAKALLASTELTVSEISYRTGFNSPSYFTRCFKEYFNENPADYRKHKFTRK